MARRRLGRLQRLGLYNRPAFTARLAQPPAAAWQASGKQDVWLLGAALIHCNEKIPHATCFSSALFPAVSGACLFRQRWAAVCVGMLIGGGVALPGQAAPTSPAVAEVAQLLQQGKAAQAAQQADAYLRKQPADVEMRFCAG